MVHMGAWVMRSTRCLATSTHATKYPQSLHDDTRASTSTKVRPDMPNKATGWQACMHVERANGKSTAHPAGSRTKQTSNEGGRVDALTCLCATVWLQLALASLSILTFVGSTPSRECHGACKGHGCCWRTRCLTTNTHDLRAPSRTTTIQYKHKHAAKLAKKGK